MGSSRKLITKYYATLTKRDRIRIDGVNHPIWKFLEVQPDGWLTSLAYPRPPIPEGAREIVDCGAWTYRNEQYPVIGKNLVTPEWAFEQYSLIPDGPIVITPDHMLIDGVNLEYRRQLNKKFAKEFLRLCSGSNLKPMAVAHGMDIKERLDYTAFLVRLGYQRIALGGLAARKSDKVGNVKFVSEVRQRWPDTYLHVLGLSSEDYCKNWVELGVDSFDGASHYKRGIASGYFYQENGVDYYKAAKYHGMIDFPECNCRSCLQLRNFGIDTRSFGNGNRNIGRATHNLNVLIKRHRWHTKKKVVFVSCVGQKQKGTHSAKDLYQSTWFHKARRYAEDVGDQWLVLSAKHGVVAPDDQIADYDVTLNKMDVKSRMVWGNEITKYVLKNYLPQDHKLIFLAGRKYREFTTPYLRNCGYDIEVPMMGLGIGQQLQWLDRHNGG
jgi:hypothetical protein